MISSGHLLVDYSVFLWFHSGFIVDDSGLIVDDTGISMVVPSGKGLHNGKSPCLMEKLTISMAMFDSDVELPESNLLFHWDNIYSEYH